MNVRELTSDESEDLRQIGQQVKQCYDDFLELGETVPTPEPRESTWEFLKRCDQHVQMQNAIISRINTLTSRWYDLLGNSNPDRRNTGA